MLRSKMETMFEGLKGAALYRTDFDFDALFLPRGQSFNPLRVTEQQEGSDICTS
jgi:hypothetical protein